METKIVTLDTELEKSLLLPAKIIKEGGLVVFPTETVYGLGGDATSPSAAEKIYRAKGRPSDNPLIVHIAHPCDAENFAFTSDVYYSLAKDFMPGPLTVILKAKPSIPKETRGGLDTVALRCPENIVARTLIKLAGVPIAAPSANLSGSPSPTNLRHVLADMNGRVDAIIDGSESEIGLESTIVKLNDDGSLTLLRPGKITPEELFARGYDIRISDAVTDELKDGEVALSPGLRYKHYAPKANFVLLEGTISKIYGYINNDISEHRAFFSYEEDLEESKSKLSGVRIYNFGKKDSKEEQAHRLFSLLRDADEDGCDTVFAALPEKDGIGLALYNRMIRAAAHKIIRL